MKEEDLEKEYSNLEGQLEEDADYDTENPQWDKITGHSCSGCGARLTIQEYEEFEDTCEECVWNETSGVIDDEPDQELLDD